MPRATSRQPAGSTRTGRGADATLPVAQMYSTGKAQPNRTGGRGGVSAIGPAAPLSGRGPQPVSNASRSLSRSRGDAGNAVHTPVPLDTVMQMNQAAMEMLRQGRTQESHQLLIQAFEVAEGQVQRLQTALATLDAAHSQGKGNRDRKSSDRQQQQQQQAEELRKVIEAWLLSYAVTLSNLGCQLRREGKSDEALACLRDARDVEATIGSGKPSCSTMMNLSAVLLGMGEAQEALPIAKDCVTAAQEGDRVLFITALHNLAVTLGQQPNGRERSAALPTMLRALREAQEFLGEADPTTQMLKEKCSTTHLWVQSEKRRPQSHPLPLQGSTDGQDGAAAVRGGALNSSSSSAAAVGRPMTQSSPLYTGSNSLKPKSYSASGTQKKPPVNLAPLTSAETQRAGEAHNAWTSEQTSAPVQSESSVPGAAHTAPVHPSQKVASRREDAKALDELPRVGMTTADGTPRPMPQSFNKNAPAAQAGSLPKGSQPSPNSLSSSSTPHECNTRSASGDNATATHDLDETAAYRDAALLAKISTEAVLATDAIDGAAVPASCHKCPSVDLMWDGSVSSRHMTELNAKITELNNSVSASSCGHLEQQRGSVLAKGHRVNIYTGDQPSFLRFAAVEDMRAMAHKPSENVYLTYQQIREKLRRQRAATVGGDTDGVDAQARGSSFVRTSSPGAPDGNGDDADMNGDVNGTRGSLKKSVFSSVSGSAAAAAAASSRSPGHSARETQARRAQRLAQEKAEEEAYRRHKALKDAVAQEEADFNAALAVIVNRTHDRAAHVIQKVWTPWWNDVGRPRREAQVRRAAERERRLRDRLAALADSAYVEQLQHRKKTRCAINDKAGRFGPPGTVVRCGVHWLEKTAAVRYLVRHGLQRGQTPQTEAVTYDTWSSEPPKPRHTEAEVQQYVIHIQALWRGAVVRLRAKRGTLPQQQLHISPGSVTTADAEMQAYAALVIQKCYRCHRARIARRAQYVEVFTLPVTVLQRWYRATIESQRARGVDGRTVRRNNRAALMIQCAWRCYQARLRLCMAQLQKRIRDLRAAEQADNLLAYEEGQRLMIEARRTEEERETRATLLAEAATAEAAAEQARRDELANRKGFVSAYSGKFYPDIEVTHNEYETECLERVYDVYRKQEADYEDFDVPLHVAPTAERTRQDWADRVALRPFVVARRRAAEELRSEEEVYALRRHRAARKIQRTFRAWLRHRDNVNRDITLLLISRGKYQQAGLEHQIQRKQRRRQQERAALVFGDQARAMRETVQALKQELAEQEALAQQHRLAQVSATVDLVSLPPSPSPLIDALRSKNGATAATTSNAEDGAGLRSRAQRWVDEKALRQEENFVASTYPREVAKLRGVTYYKGYGETEGPHSADLN